MMKIFAIAGVVLKEMFRRKDFYVLFIITVLLSVIMASVNFFNELQSIIERVHFKWLEYHAGRVGHQHTLQRNVKDSTLSNLQPLSG